MTQQNTVKFATFGPNRGLSLFIGAYQFIEGICEVPEKDASSASSILTRYHDVCHAHELEQKIAEYDAAQQNRTAVSGNLQPENPPANPAQSEKPATPQPAENPQPGENPPAPKPEASKEPPAPDSGDAGNAGEADADAKKSGNGKKQAGKN